MTTVRFVNVLRHALCANVPTRLAVLTVATTVVQMHKTSIRDCASQSVCRPRCVGHGKVFFADTHFFR